MTWTQTEAETWEALAQCIDRGGMIFPNYSYRWGQARAFGGLCWALQSLGWSAEMPHDQRLVMEARVVSHGPRPNAHAYRWPLMPEGDRQRAAFCRRMAKLARCEATGGAA